MDIIYATDNNFVDVLYASINSLFEKNKEEIIKVWIIASEVDENNKDKLQSLVKNYSKKEITLLENIELPTSIKLDRGSASQYSRLYLASALPDSVEKVLYLDADTIVMSNISDLFNQNLDGKIVAGVSDVINKDYKKVLNIPKEKPIFNTGVLLINLNEWREKEIENKIADVISKNDGNVIQGDVGILNAVLYSDYKELSPKYNYMTIFEDFSYTDMMVFKKPVNYYSEAELKKDRENIVIRHYTTSFLSKRPWQKDSTVAHVEEFKKYYKGEYKEVVPSKILKAYNILPKKIAIHLIGFLQSKIRPKVYKLFK